MHRHLSHLLVLAGVHHKVDRMTLDECVEGYPSLSRTNSVTPEAANELHRENVLPGVRVDR